MTPKQSTSPPEQAELLESIELLELLDKSKQHRQVTQTVIQILVDNPNLASKDNDIELMKEYAKKIRAYCNPDTPYLLNNNLVSKHLNGVLQFTNGLISLKEQLEATISSKKKIISALERLTKDTRLTSKYPDINHLINAASNLQNRLITAKDIRRFNEDAGYINNYINNHDGSQKNKLKNNVINTIDSLKTYLNTRSN